MWILLSQICNILNKNKVEYIIIGGTSVAYYGYSRKTKESDNSEIDDFDFDFWYRPTIINYKNLINSLIELGFDKNDVEEEYFTKFYVFRKNFDGYKLDFIPLLDKFSQDENKELFKKFYNRRTISCINNIDIPFISKEDLIYTKKISNRPKDKIDIEELNKLK